MNLMGWDKIQEFVLKYDYCCGCGVCAGICSHHLIEMRFNDYGEYRPYLSGDCNNCGKCANVCPFISGNPNEDELSKKIFSAIPNIKQTVETGYFLDAFVGYVTDSQNRWESASGGMTTWVLEKLITEKVVDHVLCVSSNDDPDQLFKYTVCSSIEDIQKCSKSCYYPVTTAEILSFVAKNEARYAIVGLPCVCKAIRLAQKQSKKYRDRIKCVIGLVCGQTKSKGFGEFICALAGGDPHKIEKLEFRIKNDSRPASDFGLRYTCKSNGGSSEPDTIFWTQGMSGIWVDKYFTPNACNFCDDIFAECADLALMDAWLPEYKKDPKGHNLIVIRDNRIREFLSSKVDDPSRMIQNISIDLVIKSQLGVVCSKRGGLRDRIFQMKKNGIYVPRKRWDSATTLRPLGMWQYNNAQYRISQKSKIVWKETGKNRDDFLSKMKMNHDEIEHSKRIIQRYRIINAVLRKGGLYKKWAATRFYS